MKLVWFWFRNSLGGLAARVEGILNHHTSPVPYEAAA